MLGWIPLFSNATGGVDSSGTIFFVGIVLAIMVLPIVTALSREVFAQTPVTHKEARAGPRRHPLGDDPHRRCCRSAAPA